MIYLIITSVIWAFSFGLIKNQLSGLDPNLVAFLRLFISLMVFIPFLSLSKLNFKYKNKSILLHLSAVGAIQFGLMYVCYIYAFKFLKAHEVALFTILTPIYVILINDYAYKKTFNAVSVISALLAVIGAGVIVYKRMGEDLFITGVLLVQASNLCFAAGQVYYKHIMNKFPNLSNSEVFAVPYFGGAAITLIFSLFSVEWGSVVMTGKELGAILYLGVVASGICFFLWNKGATMVKTPTLAVMNNVKIPLAVLCSVFVFGEVANWNRLIIGGGIMLFSVLMSDQDNMKKYRWWRKKSLQDV